MLVKTYIVFLLYHLVTFIATPYRAWSFLIAQKLPNTKLLDRKGKNTEANPYETEPMTSPSILGYGMKR